MGFEILKSSFWITFWSVIPSLIYIIIIFMNIPYGILNFKRSLLFLFFGFISVAILKYLFVLFPFLNDLAFDIASPFYYPIFYYLAKTFIEIAFIEELSKLVTFIIVSKILYKKYEHPVASMFYCSMISLGFSVIENIAYGLAYGKEVLYIRAVTSVLAHMTFGMFMGYWISMGKIGPRLYNRSLFDILVVKKRKLRIVIYTAIGLLSASVGHGLYNFNLMIESNSMYFLLILNIILLLFGAGYCAKDLRKQYQKIKKEANYYGH